MFFKISPIKKAKNPIKRFKDFLNFLEEGIKLRLAKYDYNYLYETLAELTESPYKNAKKSYEELYTVPTQMILVFPFFE